MFVLSRTFQTELRHIFLEVWKTLRKVFLGKIRWGKTSFRKWLSIFFCRIIFGTGWMLNVPLASEIKRKHNYFISSWETQHNRLDMNLWALPDKSRNFITNS